MATLGGGPTTLAGTGSSAMMRGEAPDISMIEIVSGSGALRTIATPFSSTILPSVSRDRDLGQGRGSHQSDE
jgi:hypothetical protein